MEKVILPCKLSKVVSRDDDELAIEEEETICEESVFLTESVAWKTLHDTIQEINKYANIGKDEKVKHAYYLYCTVPFYFTIGNANFITWITVSNYEESVYLYIDHQDILILSLCILIIYIPVTCVKRVAI